MKPCFCEHSSARNPIKPGGSAGRGAGEDLPTPRTGTAFFLQIFRAILSTRESPNVNFHSRFISVTSSKIKETFPSPGSQEEPEGCLALVVNPEVNQRRGSGGTPAGARLTQTGEGSSVSCKRRCHTLTTITPLTCAHIRDMHKPREKQKKKSPFCLIGFKNMYLIFRC